MKKCYELDVIRRAAERGSKNAAAWLRGEGFIKVGPNRATFVRFADQIGRWSAKRRHWTITVFSRDNFKCVECGARRNLQAHHIKPWATHPRLRFFISNGMTLCRRCHAKKHPKQAQLIMCAKRRRMS